MNLKLMAFFLMLCTYGTSQVKLDLDHWKNMKFRNIGPAGMSGRVTAIDVDLSNDQRIFLGSASGGVWLSENGGISFKPIFDEQSNLSIGSIKINQNNPSEIWVGTGEGNPRNSLNTGNGIYKTIDGGKTWKNMGLEKTKTIHRIIIHKDNPDVVLVAALGSPWGPNEDRGVFKTIDGGKSWKKVLYNNSLTGAADMVVDPSNPNKIIAAMWEHQRQPWFFNSGGSGSGMYVTFDAGDTWKKITDEDGLPKGQLGRMGLAFAPSKPKIVYALVEAKENGLYKSEDGGLKWKLVSTKDIGNRPFYYSEIYVDPKNENRLYNVYTYLSRSDDGGKSFRQIADYGNAVHPDHHALWIHPEKPDFIVDGNDGGAAISRDMGNSWTFISNLPVGQFYHINVDNDFPYHVYGGMQDNGSWVGPSSVLKAGGIRNTDFQELYFGDGFDVVPLPSNSRYGYAMSQGGSLGFYDRETGNTRFIKPVHPEGKTVRYNWNAAIAQDPYSDCGVYYGSQYVHYSSDCGENWVLLSGDLTTNDTSKLKQQLTGGLTPDATGAENHCTIMAIAPSPKDKNVIWVGSDDGNVQITKNGGKTWTNVASAMPGLPKAAWIPQIEVSKTNPGEAFVVANDYRRNDYSAYAYHTMDYGNSWTRIADNTQIKSFVVCIVQDPTEPNLLFLGSDAGLYISFNKGKNWQLWDKGFPQVQVADMKIQEREKDLVIATFGRSLWILDDITPLRALAKGSNYLADDFKVFNAGVAYSLSYASYSGVRFYAQGDFTGDNDGMGNAADVYVWSKPKSKEKDDKKNEPKKDKKDDGKENKSKTDDKVRIVVLNESGDTIRRKSSKLEGGLEKISWYFDMDGTKGISKRDADKDADPPSGPEVLPGKYKLVATYKGKKDSTSIDFKSDPRLDYTLNDYKKKQAALLEFSKLRERAGKAYDQIKEGRKQLKALEALLALQDDSVKTKIEKLQKPVKSRLDSLDKIFFVEEDAKGYVYEDDKLSSLLGEASYYLQSSKSGFNTNSKASMEIAQKKVESIVNGINDFYNTDWAKYKVAIEALGIKIFKDRLKLE
jgi:photosystem II stability/assembly factor-like uncharacterized protein